MDESKIWDGWNIRDCGVKPDGGEALRRYERRRKYRNERIGILSIVEKINPRLIYGHRDIKCTDDEVSKLLERIAENSESIRVKQGHNFLVQGLEAGKKKLGWKINVPSPMVNIKRDSSPFRPSQFHTLKKLYLIINRFNESIEDEYYYKNSSSWKKQNNNTKEIFIKNYHAGQILLSAIVNGGILSKKWLDGFGDALKHRVVIDDDYLWLDLEVNIKNSTRKDHRRWFADPVTGLLILKWKNKYGDTWIDDTTNIGQRKQNELCIRNFFRGMGLKYKDSFPVSKLINSASTLLSMSLPQFLIKYAESPTMSPSLSPLTWIRLRHDRQGIINKEENKKDEIVDIDINIRTNNTKVTTGDQIKNLRKLQSILGLYHHRNAPSIGEICKKIESFIDSAQLNPIVAYLAYWCLIRMRSTRLTGSKVKPSSMNTYLSTIGTDLIRNMIEYNPVELDEEDWMEIYEKVIDSGANNKIKNRRKRRLREFHDFLVVYEGFPKVYFSGCEQEENIVDVNIISPKEYMQILLVLSQDSYDSERLRKIRRIVFTLGYRCGLRRKEVLTIQIRNLQILDCKGGNAKEGSELLIVSNSQGKLKTKKSTRRIPLEYLLTDEEFEELYQWKQKRIREVKGSKIVNQLLFCNIANDIEVLSDKELFQPIHFAMRMVTGDYSLHYQNLRHSFATMLILRLTQDSYKNILPESWVTENGKYLLPLENESILDKLLNRSEFRPTRKNVYLVSNLCGHNGPKETLDTYIHCLDWIMGRVLHEYSETLSLKKQAYLLGQSRGSIKVYRSRNNLTGETKASDIFNLQIRKHKKHYKDPMLRKTKEKNITLLKTIIPPAYNEEPPSIEVLYRIFKLYSQKTNISNISNTFGYDQIKIKRWIENAKKISLIETWFDNFRHIKVDNSRKEKDLERNPILPGLCPAFPHKRGDSAMATLVHKGILSAGEKDKEAIIKGLKVFLGRSTVWSSELKLIKENDVLDYINMLKLIKIPVNRINIELYNVDVTSMKKSITLWSKLLGLPKNRINIINEEDENTRVLVWLSNTINDLSVEKTRDTPEKWASYGAKFGFFMGAVYLGISLDLKQNKEERQLIFKY